jgi:hypothetical protein
MHSRVLNDCPQRLSGFAAGIYVFFAKTLLMIGNQVLRLSTRVAAGKMKMLIRYSDDSFVEGMIQRLEGDRLWVTVAGLESEVEFILIDGEWVSESGKAVTFEFPVKVSMELIDIVVADEDGRCAAGGDCVLRRMWSGECSPPN